MKLFQTVKEIRSNRGELHFRRYAIVECSWFNIYIHHIFKADEDYHMHDHPWDYTSVVLSGKFLEKSLDEKYVVTTSYFPVNISQQKATRLHKLWYLMTPKVVTLFFTGPRKRVWGYSVNGNWIDNETYRTLKRDGKLPR